MTLAKTKSNPTWRTRIITTLLAWMVAFVIVYVLLSLFGGWLESLPLALNALIFTGILVPIMGNLVVPYINTFVSRAYNMNNKE